MTKDRIKATILRLLEQMPADDLSVKMVVREAKVSKQTLYNNYYGLLGAMEDMIQDLMTEAAEKSAGEDNWAEQIRAITHMFAERKEVFIHLYFSKYRDDLMNLTRARALPHVSGCMRNYEANAGVSINDYDMQILVEAFMDIYIGGIDRFFRGRLTDDPDCLMNLYDVIVRGMATPAIIKMSRLETSA